jgi:hypothetical protein
MAPRAFPNGKAGAGHRHPRELRVAEKAGVAPAGTSDLLLASRGYAVGPGGVGRADPMAFDLSSHLEPGGGGDRRRWPSVDGADDLAAIDALQVDAGDAKVGVPKLTLDDYERNALRVGDACAPFSAGIVTLAAIAASAPAVRARILLFIALPPGSLAGEGDRVVRFGGGEELERELAFCSSELASPAGDPDDLGPGQRSVRQVHEPDREELSVV